MKKKLCLILSVLLVAVFVLAACGNSEYTLKISVQNDLTAYESVEVLVDGNPFESQGEGMQVEFETKLSAGDHKITILNPADSTKLAEGTVNLNKSKLVTIIISGTEFTFQEDDLN